MHMKEKHIHVHMVIFSTDPKEGYLTKQGIKQIKSALVRQVYKDDLLNVYQKQTAHRHGNCLCLYMHYAVPKKRIELVCLNQDANAKQSYANPVCI